MGQRHCQPTRQRHLLLQTTHPKRRVRWQPKNQIAVNSPTHFASYSDVLISTAAKTEEYNRHLLDVEEVFSGVFTYRSLWSR